MCVSLSLCVADFVYDCLFPVCLCESGCVSVFVCLCVCLCVIKQIKAYLGSGHNVPCKPMGVHSAP